MSTGGTARALRDAGLPVTDVAAVTGSPEMLDGRVKTLHPRIHAGLLADRRLEDHRLQLLDAGIAPFEVVVVNLYPFAAALDRPGITVDELIEEIDIGGPSMVRAAAKNHANVAIVTSPGQYDDLLAALDAPGGLDDRRRRAWALDAFAHTAAYDARIAAALPGRMIDAGLLDPPEDPYPPSLTIGLEKVETLRYGENPHQAAARYRRPGSTPADGPFASGAPPLQGKALSYNNVLDASAAAAIGRALRGPACVIVKHTNPCGAAERATVVDAWTAALEADPVSAFGGVVAVTRPVDATLAGHLVSIFLEVVVAPGFEPAALAVLAGKPNLRLVVDPVLADDGPGPAPDPTGLDPQRRWRGPRHRPGHDPGRPGGLDRRDAPCADRRRAARPRPRLAAGPWRHVQRHRARARRAAHRARVRADVAGRRRPRRRRPGPGLRGTGGRGRGGVRLGCVLPVRRRRRGLSRGGRHRVRAARRLGPRRRGRGGGGCGRGDHGHDGHAALPPLMAGSVATRPAVLIRPWHTPMTGRDPAEAHRASTPLELLFDLCFVVAVSQAAGSLHHDLAAGRIGHGVVNYLVVFFAIWWPWMNFTWFASAYDTDDVQYRLLTFVQIAGVLVVAAGVPAAFERQDFTVMVIGYVIMRIALVAQWLRAAREDPVGRPVALRFATAIALIQVAWVVRLLVGWSEIGYLTFLVLGILELAVPAWAERAGRHTPWHGGHIVERYGLFTIIVLGECVLATMTATQAAFAAGGLLLPLLTVAIGGLLLVFAMWWSYFKHEPDVGHHRSLRSMIGWGYGHYFVFAAAAALGAGLEVAADTTVDAADLGPAVAAATVAVPVAIYLVAVAVLHARGMPQDPGQLAVFLALILGTALAAPAIGVPTAVVVMALLVCGLVALSVVRVGRRTA